MIDYEPCRAAGHLIRRCLRIHDTIFTELTAGFEITPPQLAALDQIAKHPQIELSVLADMIAYDGATIGGIVDRLEAKGLVRRTPGTADRRKKHLSLTKAGHAVLVKVAAKANRVEGRLLKDLDAGERRQFLDMLNRVAGLADASEADGNMVA